MKSAIIVLSILFMHLGLKAVNPPADLNGESLKEWLRQNYYEGKHTALGYNEARAAMYGYIDNKNNTVVGVYSGYEVSLSYGSYSTYPEPVNCEHTVPQSFFSKAEPMRSDIHHLFPTYENWNSTRSNFPFAEIDDNKTAKWMNNSSSSSSIPNNNIDEYSEYYSSNFEPKEDHKGNCARAIFYFYTMYPSQAGDISRVGDINTLYQWHLNDPVDAAEKQRNDDIETYQGNRNPYIDYPELVARAYDLEKSSSLLVPTIQLSTTESSIELSWTNVENETGYSLYKSNDGNIYSKVIDLNANKVSYYDENLNEGNTYYYYVVAFNDEENSSSSNIVDGRLSGSSSDGDSEYTSEIFISEYIEGSSYNKAVEIANYTGSTVDLSAYSLKLASNGETAWDDNITLSGNLPNGNVYVVSHGNASVNADLTSSSVINFNGDDAIGLFKNDILIDIVNTLGNPNNNNVVKDMTLVRKLTVNSPNTVF